MLYLPHSLAPNSLGLTELEYYAIAAMSTAIEAFAPLLDPLSALALERAVTTLRRDLARLVRANRYHN